ncbi:MAG: maleylpyruvate isomerase family mycothiol-dependent enzyme [Actinomycetia bacterium]|nr:maleylpyruvate isomerase family mycothiol-dependent enzyme [Actinomycetes bacterium]
MEIAEHIRAVGREANLLAVAARQGGLNADVPTCPGWEMRELLRHLSMIHLWAAGHVSQLHDGSWGDDLAELTEFWPDLAAFWPDDEKLIDWYLETNANLVHELESAPLNVESWTFLPAPSPLAMWARRQAHETAIHRFDAQNAAGIPSGFDPVFAADGIDELIAGMAPRRKEFPIESAKAMLVHATDTNDRWHITLAPDGITTVRDDGPADGTLTGDASDLYLVLWNRREDSRITITGDSELLDKWHDNVRVRWS